MFSETDNRQLITDHLRSKIALGGMMENNRNRVIVVDDAKTNSTNDGEFLKSYYEVYPAQSAKGFFELLESINPDLILLDIEMPEMNGFDVIRKLRENPNYLDIPVIFLTDQDDEPAELEEFELGAVDYVTKPFSESALLRRISNQLLITRQKKELLANQAVLRDYTENLEEKAREKDMEVSALQNAVMSSVADLVKFRDKNTGSHASRTQRYLQTLVDGMIRYGVYVDEVVQWDMELLLTSAQLHDVGKIAITDLILNKPDKLTPEEFEIMKTHVKVGVEAVKQLIHKTKAYAFLDHALRLVGSHHEKWDGTGYPDGLKGEEIPIEGRLMAIVDVYDALISERPYKNALSHEEARRIVENSAGSQFDPALVEVFTKIEDEFNKITQETRMLQAKQQSITSGHSG